MSIQPGIGILEAQWSDDTDTTFVLTESNTVTANIALGAGFAESTDINVDLRVGGFTVASTTVTVTPTDPDKEFSLTAELTSDDVGVFDAEVVASGGGDTASDPLEDIVVEGDVVVGDANLSNVAWIEDNTVPEGGFTISAQGDLTNNTNVNIAPQIELLIDGNIIGTRNITRIEPGRTVSFVVDGGTILDPGTYSASMRALYGTDGQATASLPNVTVSEDATSGPGGNLLSNPAVIIGGSVVAGLAVSEWMRRQ